MNYRLATKPSEISTRKKHIVLLTSGQPASNPRLLKEADCLHSYGYEVTVICCYWNAWANLADKQLMRSRNWNYVQVGGNPASAKLSYILSKIIHVCCRKAAKLGLPTRQYALSRATLSLTRAAKASKADLYIAHNLAALPAAIIAAKKHQASPGFDAEDYHRAETATSPKAFHESLKIWMEDSYIPKIKYFTTSSPLIAHLYAEHYGSKPKVIRNALKKINGLTISRSTGVQDRLKLCWFSQTIGHNRGLELVLQALCYLDKDAYELHLLGALATGYRQILFTLCKQLELPADNIHIHDPVLPDALFVFCGASDIGLACETGFCKNNEVALSNKLFTYIQSGLAVLLSDTPAQQLFFNEHPGIGRSYQKSNPAQLASAIQYYIDHRDVLQQTKLNNYHLGQQLLNWETESKHLITQIKSILHE